MNYRPVSWWDWHSFPSASDVWRRPLSKVRIASSWEQSIKTSGIKKLFGWSTIVLASAIAVIALAVATATLAPTNLR
jgi:hypothetical protein